MVLEIPIYQKPSGIRHTNIKSSKLFDELFVISTPDDVIQNKVNMQEPLANTAHKSASASEINPALITTSNAKANHFFCEEKLEIRNANA